MTEAPKILLAHHLKTLKLPTFLREYEKLARQCAAEGLDHVQFLARLVELELIDRERRMVERRIKAAKFPAAKSLDSFDFKAIPKLNKMQVLELARCEWIERRENVIALGPSGTGKTHVALGLGLAACQKGLSVSFITAAALVNELMEARDERRLLRLQKQLAAVKLLIIDELGFVPLSKTGAELLFELISQRYERGATMITSNLPFDEWTETFGTERLTGALLDRLTHHVNILEMNGDSYRLGQSRARKVAQPSTMPKPKVADFCAAEWPDFAPPLTAMLQERASRANGWPVSAGSGAERDRAGARGSPSVGNPVAAGAGASVELACL
jgi:DNA replication protein DnaC